MNSRRISTSRSMSSSRAGRTVASAMMTTSLSQHRSVPAQGCFRITGPGRRPVTSHEAATSPSAGSLSLARRARPTRIRARISASTSPRSRSAQTARSQSRRPRPGERECARAHHLHIQRPVHRSECRRVVPGEHQLRRDRDLLHLERPILVGDAALDRSAGQLFQHAAQEWPCGVRIQEAWLTWRTSCLAQAC
jgi:hypothetical protein